MKWTIGLTLLMIIDSMLTIHIGYENNYMILWVMNKFNLFLSDIMILRIFYYIPLIYIVHKWGYSKLTFMSYIGIYIFNASFVAWLENFYI